MGDRPWAHNAAKLSPGPTVVCSSVIPVYRFAPRRIVTVCVRALTECTGMWPLIGPRRTRPFPLSPTNQRCLRLPLSASSGPVPAHSHTFVSRFFRKHSDRPFYGPVSLALGSGNEREFFSGSKGFEASSDFFTCIMWLEVSLSSQEPGTNQHLQSVYSATVCQHRSAHQISTLVYRPLCINVKIFSPLSRPVIRFG